MILEALGIALGVPPASPVPWCLHFGDKALVNSQIEDIGFPLL